VGSVGISEVGTARRQSRLFRTKTFMCENSNLVTGLWLEEVEHQVHSGLMTLGGAKIVI